VDVAKHPRTLSLLRTALAEAEKPVGEASPDKSGVPAPSQDSSKEAKSEVAKSATPGKVVSRLREPSKNLIRIKNYGKEKEMLWNHLK